MMWNWIRCLSRFEYAFILGIIAGFTGLILNFFTNLIVPEKFNSYSISLVGFIGVFIIGYLLSGRGDEKKD